MEQINFLTKLSNITLQSQLRLDPKYRYFKDERNNRTSLLNSIEDKKDVALSSILELAKTSVVKKGELEEEMILVDLDDIEAGFGSLKQERLVSEIGSDKTIFGNSDIVCSKLTPEKGHFFINDKNKKYIGTTELIGYRLKNHHWNIKFLLYLLLHKDFRGDLEFLTSGKTHPRIQIPDFLAMRIPFVSYDRQVEAIKKIEEKENKILQIKSKIESLQDIIDEIFIKYFLNTNNTKKENDDTIFSVSFSKIYEFKNNQLRFSYHYSHPRYNKFLKNISKRMITTFNKVFEIKGGKRIPKGYTFSKEETSFRYLRPNEIKDLYIDYENMPYISEKLYNMLKRYKINPSDFAISIVGTLGKIAWFLPPEILKDQEVILSENFAKLKLINKDIEPNYLFYFLNSIFLKVQIDKEYTITTQMKLGLDKLYKLFVLIPENREIEQKIVSEIQEREGKNNQYKEQIKKLREEIDDLIYYSLK